MNKMIVLVVLLALVVVGGVLAVRHNLTPPDERWVLAQIGDLRNNSVCPDYMGSRDCVIWYAGYVQSLNELEGRIVG